jgi:Sulfotransferase family
MTADKPANPLAGLVAGMPRAGTTWLIKTLNAHPDAAAFGETQFWGRSYVTPDQEGNYGPTELRAVAGHLKHNLKTSLSAIGEGPGCLKALKPEGIDAFVEAFIDGLESPLTPAEVFRHLCAAIAAVEGKQCCVEKTPHHVNWLDRIWQALPGTRAVLMIRNPYEFALSYKHADRIATIARKGEYRQLYHPLGCALVWRTSLRAALRARLQRPKQVLVMNLAEVRSDAVEVLNRIQRFLGLSSVEIAGSVPADNSSFSEGPKPSLQAEDVFWINLICRREIREMDFEPQSCGFSPWRVLLSLCRIPIWIFRKTGDLHRRSAGSTLSYIWRWLRPVR